MSVPPSTPLALDGQQAVAIVQQAAGYLPMYFAFTASIASTRTFSSIMTAIVVFDHFATFPSEWRYLWRAKPGWISLCLLINRYGIIASLGYILYLWYYPTPEDSYCRRMIGYAPNMPTAVLVFANLLLISRVWALWERNKFVLGGMLLLLVGMVIAHLWVSWEVVPMVLGPGIPELGVPSMTGCLPGEGIRLYYLNFTMSTVFDAAAFILSVIPCLTKWKASMRTGILSTLLRDGVFFFAICLIANLVNIIYSLTLDPKTQNVAYLAPLSTAIQSISASRMVFNLREASEGKVTSTSGLSAIRTHVTHHTVSDGGTPAHKLSAFSFARSNLATPHLSDPIDAEEKAETHELGEKLEVIDLNGHRSYR